jgi:hypothetical protein
MSTPDTSGHAELLPYCRNCHYTLSQPRPRHCGHCGQETDLHPPSVREMFTEYLGHYVALDGPLWRTLWTLIGRPGQLTLEYFHGRRRRFVLPLRVYLTASFLFFVGSHLLPGEEEPKARATPAVAAAASATRQSAKDADDEPVYRRDRPASGAAAELDRITYGDRIESCVKAAPGCSPLDVRIAQSMERMNAHGMSGLKARMLALAPYGMLVMQPVFAALLLAVFAGTGRRYAEHFVFSLHLHSLWFLALLVSKVIGLEPLIAVLVFAHGLVALRRVYGVGRLGAWGRGLLLCVGYGLLLVVGLLALFVVIAVTS